MATHAVLDAAKTSLDASVVLPSGIIGPGDTSGGSITELLLSFLAGKLPIAVRGGYDFVDVRDVAAGIVSCAEKGVRGKCYILSGHYATIRDILETVGRSTGINKAVSYLPVALAKIIAPFYELDSIRRKKKLFFALAKIIAPFYEFDSIRRKKKLFFTPYAVHVLQSNALFSGKAAAKDLGYAPRSLKETLIDTVKWLKKSRSVAL
ncbi:nAD dependent epimerase/dehydratase family protein [Clostridium sp. CAG:448]|nr:nAD dependent epimerase/dehydratase family protein [Clostridium sp. CAG:448]